MPEDSSEAPAEESQEQGSEEGAEANENYKSDFASFTYETDEDGTSQEGSDSSKGRASNLKVISRRKDGDKSSEDSLEARVASDDEEISSQNGIVEKIAFLKSKGYSAEKIEHMLSANEYSVSVEKMPNGIRSLIYLVLGFLENPKDNNETVYKQLAEKSGTPVLFFPGLLHFPYKTEQVAKYSGLNVIRVDTRDPEEIKAIVEYAKSLTGFKPILLGYSDGGKTITNAVEALGGRIRENVRDIIFVSANKEPSKVPGILYIDGGNDKLAPLESGYGKPIDSGSTRVVVKGMGHVDMVYNPGAIAQIGNIIKAHSRIGTNALPSPYYRAA